MRALSTQRGAAWARTEHAQHLRVLCGGGEAARGVRQRRKRVRESTRESARRAQPPRGVHALLRRARAPRRAHRRCRARSHAPRRRGAAARASLTRAQRAHSARTRLRAR
jgi:hypothetical protein